MRFCARLKLRAFFLAASKMTSPYICCDFIETRVAWLTTAVYGFLVGLACEYVSSAAADGARTRNGSKFRPTPFAMPTEICRGASEQMKLMWRYAQAPRPRDRK